MEHRPTITSVGGAKQRILRASNDNGTSRRVVVRLRPPALPCMAEIEVFGAILAALTPANDNDVTGDAL